MRFIEYMPFSGNRWDKDKLFPSVEILKVIREQYAELEHVPTSADSTAKVFFRSTSGTCLFIVITAFILPFKLIQEVAKK